MEEILGDGRWLAHRFDYDSGRYQFVFMPREEHRRTSFLTDHFIAPDRPRRTLERSAATAAAKPRVPLHFIFHSGLACSTLLARALDEEGVAMTLKEPAILSDVVGYRLRTRRREELDRALDDALAMLARPLVPGEPLIAKVASVGNGLAQRALEGRPDSQAICLHAPLPVFLASIARKQLVGRLWGRKLFVGLRNAGMIDLGFSDSDYFKQTDLQVAAMAWVAQQLMFVKLVERFGPDRVRTIDSETLMERP